MHYILVFQTNAASRNAQYCPLLFICIAYKTSNHLLNLSHTAPFKQSFMLLYIYIYFMTQRVMTYTKRVLRYTKRVLTYTKRVMAYTKRVLTYTKRVSNSNRFNVIINNSSLLQRLVKHHNVFFVNDEQCEFANKKSHISYTAHNFQN